MHKNIYYFLTTSSECHYFVLQIIVCLLDVVISDTLLRVRSYHFILIDIELDRGMVTVMESLRKDISEYVEIKNSFAR